MRALPSARFTSKASDSPPKDVADDRIAGARVGAEGGRKDVAVPVGNDGVPRKTLRTRNLPPMIPSYLALPTANVGDRFQARIAPAFAPHEAEVIAAWSATMRRRDVYTEINLSHLYLTEALHVLAGSADESWWLVHKTPDGEVAVRCWPGLAEIVPTIEDALYVVVRELPAREAIFHPSSVSDGSHGDI